MTSSRGSRSWQSRIASMAEGRKRQVERVQAMLAARREADARSQVRRPGISISTPTRFATTAAPSDWLEPERGRPIIEAISSAVEDGTDRVVLAWPGRPGSGFVATALALRSARSSGRLAYATSCFWPWRSGATWAARSILVSPTDLSQAAARAITDIQNRAEWTTTRLAHESLSMLEIRLRDLRNRDDGSSTNSGTRNVVVRSPTLLETTAVFGPADPPSSVAFARNSEQIFRRVRDFTHLGDRNAGLETHFAAVGDPMRSPFAVFGLTPNNRANQVSRLLNFDRFKEFGIDVVVADVTRAGRANLPDDWEPLFVALLESLDSVSGRRPPVVVIAEDAFSLRRAIRSLRSHNSALQPARRPPIELGLFLPEPGLLGSSAALNTALPPIQFEADIKDASLAHLRQDLVSLGRNLRQGGHTHGAEGVSKALAFLRRAASLPLGLREARDVADILFDGDDEVDAATRGLFRPKMALSQLAAAADIIPMISEPANRLVAAVEARVSGWTEETPVSGKLSQVLQDQAWNCASTLLSISDRRVADIFLSSDRGVACACEVIEHRAIAEHVRLGRSRRMIVIGPTPEAVRALLTMNFAPDRVLLLGDTAGSALLTGEIAPLMRISEFSALANRVSALSTALQRGGANEQLDLAEAEFRIAAVVPEAEIDFTQAGERYAGDIIQLRSSRGTRIDYRPNSDVLEFSAGEIRPFERVPARAIKRGDRILVLDAAVREPLRRALAGSRESLQQLSLYHNRIADIRGAVPGSSDAQKARHVLRAMQALDPGLGDQEFPNVLRWLTADQARGRADGAKQPRAARDWARFRLFMRAVGIDATTADIYWRAAVVPARSYRAQEGHSFNQRVVQFVLDPEGSTAGSAAWKTRQGLWQSVLDSVDEVVDVRTVSRGPEDG